MRWRSASVVDLFTGSRTLAVGMDGLSMEAADMRYALVAQMGQDLNRVKGEKNMPKEKRLEPKTSPLMEMIERT